jgi:hypothetical protein
MNNANRANTLGLGFSQKKMEELFGAALKLGQATGITAKNALDSLTIGLARQSKLVLDNIGILVDAEGATKKYAQSIGKTVDELTDQERTTAFLNEAIAQIRRKSEELPKVTLTATQKMGAAWTAFKDSFVKNVSEINIHMGRLFSGERGSGLERAQTLDERLKTAQADLAIVRTKNNRQLELAILKEIADVTAKIADREQRIKNIRIEATSELLKQADDMFTKDVLIADSLDSSRQKYAALNSELLKIQGTYASLRVAAQRGDEGAGAQLRLIMDRYEKLAPKVSSAYLALQNKIKQDAEAAKRESERNKKEAERAEKKRWTQFWREHDARRKASLESYFEDRKREVEFQKILKQRRMDKSIAGLGLSPTPGRVQTSAEIEEMNRRIEILKAYNISVDQLRKGMFSLTDVQALFVQGMPTVGYWESNKNALSDLAKNGVGRLAEGFVSASLAAIIAGESWGKAMQQILSATLQSVAQESAIMALKYTALGLGLEAATLGIPNPGSVSAFASAATWGAVAVAAGAGAYATRPSTSGGGARNAGGGSGGGGSYGGSGGSGGSSSNGPTYVSNIYSEGKNLTSRAPTAGGPAAPEADIGVRVARAITDGLHSVFSNTPVIVKIDGGDPAAALLRNRQALFNMRGNLGSLTGL